MAEPWCARDGFLTERVTETSGGGGVMDVHDRVITTVEPLVEAMGVELVDVEVAGSGRSRMVRLYVDREGGVDLETIAEVSREVSPALDADDPFSGSYTLEVSSPGLERPLRTPEHFRRVVGETVSLKTHAEVDGARRHQGELVEVDGDGVTLDVDGARRHLRFDEIAKARTVFEWGPAPKPGKGGRSGGQARRKSGARAPRTKLGSPKEAEQ